MKYKIEKHNKSQVKLTAPDGRVMGYFNCIDRAERVKKILSTDLKKKRR